MATFSSLVKTRLPVCLKYLGLLGNAGRYPHSEEEAAQLVREVDLAYQEFRKSMGHHPYNGQIVEETKTLTKEPKGTATVPHGIAEGGSTFEHEIRWAIDAIQSGRKDLAKNRLMRILGHDVD